MCLSVAVEVIVRSIDMRKTLPHKNSIKSKLQLNRMQNSYFGDILLLFFVYVYMDDEAIGWKWDISMLFWFTIDNEFKIPQRSFTKRPQIYRTPLFDGINCSNKFEAILCTDWGIFTEKLKKKTIYFVWRWHFLHCRWRNKK